MPSAPPGSRWRLSGTGGDELFGGYASFRDLPVLQRWSRRAAWIPRGLQVAAATLATSGAAPFGRNGAASDALGQAPRDGRSRRRSAGALPAAHMRSSSRDSSSELLAPDFVEALADGLPPAMRQRIVAETRRRTPLSAISVMEQRLFLGERLLRDNDVASMASSLEQRVPLVDQVLFESIDRLPDRARYQPLGRKAMLRRIGLRGLDPALVRATQERVRAAIRSLDTARPEGRHGPDPAGPAGHRSGRPRSCGGRAALAGLSRRGTRHVLVASLVGIRLRPMVPPQPRLPVRRLFGTRSTSLFSATVPGCGGSRSHKTGWVIITRQIMRFPGCSTINVNIIWNTDEIRMCCFDTLMQLYLIPNIRFIALFKQRYCEPFNCVAGASCIDFKIRRAGLIRETGLHRSSIGAHRGSC